MSEHIPQQPSLYQQWWEWFDDVKKHEITNLVNVVEKSKEYLDSAESIPEEKITQFIANVKYDLQDFYEQSQSEVKHSIYLALLQEKCWQMLGEITDQSQVEWAEFIDELEHKGEYETGDTIGFGELVCQSCGHVSVYMHASEVLPCLECGQSHFKRKPLSS